MTPLVEVSQREIRRSLEKAADRIREWVDNRLDADAMDIARLYKSSRGRLLARLKVVYEGYLRQDPTLIQARRTGALGAIESSIDLTVNELTDYLGRTATYAVTTLLADQPAVVRRNLRWLPYEDLPYSSQRVMDELTTSVIGGGTFFDHLSHMTDRLRRDVTTTARTALINGQDFDTVRSNMMRAFGVDKLAEPKSNVYGAVKVYKNEARRQWNLLMNQASEKSGALQVWWALLDDEETTPGCIARHGYAINALGELPPRHINCFVPWTRVEGNFLGGTRMSYQGRVVSIKTRQGHALTVTPNHPILTERGMRPAHSLREGDYVFSRTPNVEGAVNNQQNIPTTIQKVYDSIAFRGCWGTARTTRDDFHGDASSGYGEIDVVVVNRELLYHSAKSSRDGECKRGLVAPDSGKISHRRAGTRYSSTERIGSTSTRRPGFAELTLHEMTPSFDMLPLEPLRVGSTAQLDAVLLETSRERGTRDTSHVAQMLERFPALVTLDEIVEISDDDFFGHVYDLQSVSGCIVAEGIIVSNCRCTIAVLPAETDLTPFQEEALLVLGERGYSRARARMMESFMWGRDRLVTIAHIRADDESPRYRYQSVPWRSLASRLMHPALGFDSAPPLTEVLARANSDHVLLRRGKYETHVRTWTGWRPLRPQRDEQLIETHGGFAVDGAAHMPPWDEKMRVRAAVACYEPDGTVWAIRPRGRHVWTLPGGGVKGSEDPRDAAVREMLEETGVRVRIINLLGRIMRPHSESVIYHAEREGERGEPKTPEEIDAVMPVSLDKLVPDEASFLSQFVNTSEAQQAEFDPGKHPRGEKGTSQGGQFVYHGTNSRDVQSILKHGLSFEKGSARWGQSKKGRVYVTTSQAEAIHWSNQKIGDAKERVAILMIQIPADHAATLRRDRNVGSTAKALEFSGDIPPSWIKQVWVSKKPAVSYDPNDIFYRGQSLKTPQRDPKQWHVLKKASESARHEMLYVALMLPADENETSEALTTAEFDPGKHPRGTWGRFAPKGSSDIVSAKVGPVKISRLTHTPHFTGQPRSVRTKMSKKAMGRLGEQIAVKLLRQSGSKDAELIHTSFGSNFPIDGLHDHEAVEIKAGSVANVPKSQQWRLTIGEPGTKEKEILSGMVGEQKARYNISKAARIQERKRIAMREIEQETGRTLKARTITMIIDPDRKVADVYSFEGFHPRIGWKSPQARAGYIGTVHYEPQ